jgi:hypothetical protein
LFESPVIALLSQIVGSVEYRVTLAQLKLSSFLALLTTGMMKKEGDGEDEKQLRVCAQACDIRDDGTGNFFVLGLRSRNRSSSPVGLFQLLSHSTLTAPLGASVVYIFAVLTRIHIGLCVTRSKTGGA